MRTLHHLQRCAGRLRHGLALMLLFILAALPGRADYWNAASKYFVVGSDVLTPSHPYLEFQAIFRDFSGIDDEVRDLKFYVRLSSGSQIQLFQYGRGKNSVRGSANLYNEEYGIVTYEGSWDSGDLELGKFRYYPTARALREGANNVIVDGYWSIDSDGSHDYDIKKSFEFSYPKPSFSQSLTRVETGKVDYGVKETSSTSGESTLAKFRSAGFSLNYALYKEASRTNSVQSGTYPTSGNVRVNQTVQNDTQLTYYTTLRLTRTFSVNNVKNTTKSITQEFTYSGTSVTAAAYPAPASLRSSFDMWKKRITLTWNKTGRETSTDKWHIYRRLSSSSDAPTHVATLSLGTTTWNDEGAHIDYDTRYTYTVACIPSGWNSDTAPQGLASTTEVLTERTFPITLSVKPKDEEIELSWTHPAAKFEGTAPQFHVMYRLNRSEEWHEAGQVGVRSTSTTSHSFVHRDITSSCDTYTYRIEVAMLGHNFVSNPIAAQIEGTSHISSLTATKGTYSGRVRLVWRAEQYGTVQTQFQIFRRPFGSEDDWGQPIHTLAGTMEEYAYDDTNVAVGAYYEYKVTSYTRCDRNAETTAATYLTDNGFCQATGSIGGQVTYGTGDAVAGVRVALEKSDESDPTPLLYALHVREGSNGVKADFAARPLMTDHDPVTVECWISPDHGLGNSTLVWDMADFASLWLAKSGSASEAHLHTLKLDLPGSRNSQGKVTSYTTWAMPFVLEAGSYYHIAVSHDGKDQWTVRCTDSEGKVQQQSKRMAVVSPLKTYNIQAFSVAAGRTLGNIHGMGGYIDEVRIWNRALTADELTARYDRPLTGLEEGLLLYYPFDEGLPKLANAYDYSTTDGITNDRHGVATDAEEASYVPEVLKLYAISDMNGNYLIRGVPFARGGTNYTIRPQLGTHEFSPTVQNRYVSATSINHHGVDFTDKSSFEVSGDVFFDGTTIPVEGATLYVDGQPCSRDGQLVQTDDHGRFTIEVPIGYHYIEIRKDHHTFSADGFWPARGADGAIQRHYFDQPLSNRRFYDVTLVPVAGRVVGGTRQDEMPTACGASVANIGQAHLVLTTGDYSLNVTRDELGTAWDATTTRRFEVPANSHEWVKSEAWVEGGSPDATRRIHITTDPATGEFLALLPPCNYKVESARLVSDLSDITFSDMPRLDATNVGVVQTDTLQTAEFTRTSEFVVDYHLMHRALPDITLSERGLPDGAFGMESMDIYEPLDAHVETVTLRTTDEAGHTTYAFDYPIYEIGQEYEYVIHASERYINYDGPKPVLYEDPLVGAEVNVTNQYCGEQIVLIADGALTDSLYVGVMQLDSVGDVRYRFRAGYPNIAKPFTRFLNISVKHRDVTFDWSENGKFQAVVAGGLPTGNNFLTAGPSTVLMVLRDPPGTHSSATFAEGASFSITHNETTTAHDGYSGTKHLLFGPEVKVAAGVGLLMVNTNKTENELDIDTEAGVSIRKSSDRNYTLTTQRAISTSSSRDFVGANGDVYFGTSYNTVFGKMRHVGLYRQPSGKWALDMKEEMGMGSQFATTFTYSQFDLLYRVIPQLEEARDGLLIYDPQYKPGQPYSRFVIDEPAYVTSLQPGDYGYGTLNTDKEVWGDRATDDEMAGPSFIMVMPDNAEDDMIYENRVANYIGFINAWRETIARNEEAKVLAIEGSDKRHDRKENVSVSSGAGYSASRTFSKSKSDNFYLGGYDKIKVVCKWGFAWNGIGLVSTDGIASDFESGETDGSGETKSYSFSYNIGVDAPDRLSVDIYEPIVEVSDVEDLTGSNTDTDANPDGNSRISQLGSPIFVTRAGVTHNPYQGEERTQFYKEGTVISEATMAHEKPFLMVANPNLSGLQPGEKAVFEVHLRNDSESGDDVIYEFSPKLATTQGKPLIEMDGARFSSLRMLLHAGEETVRHIALSQTDLSETHLEVLIQLLSTSQNDPTSPVGALGVAEVLTADYLPTSSPVTVTSQQKVVNTTTGPTLPLVISDYDATFRYQQGFTLLYRYENESEMTPIASWRTAECKDAAWQDAQILPEGTHFTYAIDMHDNAVYPDGHYTFIVRSYAAPEGYPTAVTRDSEAFSLIRDTTRPTVVGNPSPSNRILGPGDVISATFNEPIEQGRLTEENIIITGRLNGAAVNHAKALQFDGLTECPTTSVQYNIQNHDFAGEAWVLLHRPDSVCSIFSHGVPENGFSLIANDQGQLGINTHGTVIYADRPIDFDRWLYVSCNYTDGEDASYIDLQVAMDDEVLTLFDHRPVDRYSVNGPFQVGRGMKGAMHELSLWNVARSGETSLSECYQTKQVFAPGLVGYWPMNEGHGHVAQDVVHAYDMSSEAMSWYCADPNLALHLDGESHIDCFLEGTNYVYTDSYTLEAWLRGTPQDATLFSMNGETLSIDATAEGGLSLTTRGKATTSDAEPAPATQTITQRKVLDGQWHHFALNMRRDGSTNAYIDGEEVAQLPSGLMPVLTGECLTIGARRTVDGMGAKHDRHFTGDLDEVRLWKGVLTANTVTLNAHNRLDPEQVEEMVLYMTFDHADDVFTRFDTEDHSRRHGRTEASPSCQEAETHPGLAGVPAVQRMRYEFVTTDRSITIRLLEDPARLHGNQINVGLRNISDLNGNLSNYVNWQFYNDVRSLAWNEPELHFVIGEEEEESYKGTMSFSNLTANSLHWRLDNLPAWLTADRTSGFVDPLGTVTLHFTMQRPYPRISSTELIDIIDEDGVRYHCSVVVDVYRKRPDWHLVAEDFDDNMTLVAKVFINGRVCNNEASLLAAFEGDRLVGLASPKYVPRYDTYLIPMTLYGTTGATHPQLIFKFWSAQSDIIYPVLASDRPLTFVAGAMEGSYVEPVPFHTTDFVEQRLDMPRGWSWISLYLDMADVPLPILLEPVRRSLVLVKDSQNFDMTDETAEYQWTSQHVTTHPGKMYMVKTSEPVGMNITGLAAHPIEELLTVAGNGWTWLGYIGTETLPLRTALADLHPADGDIVKSQHEFAIYHGDWDGTLRQMQPGKGYMYRSAEAADRTFCFPLSAMTADNSQRPILVSTPETGAAPHFTPVTAGTYSTNMTMLATLCHPDGTAVTADGDTPLELAVFAGEECRATAFEENGRFFLTIAGEQPETLTFRVWNGEEELIALPAAPLRYEGNAHYGTPAAPFRLTLSSPDGVLDITAQPEVVSIEVFNAAGQRVTTLRPQALDTFQPQPGVYMLRMTFADGSTEVQSMIR